jgi:hypothetical protein
MRSGVTQAGTRFDALVRISGVTGWAANVGWIDPAQTPAKVHNKIRIGLVDPRGEPRLERWAPVFFRGPSIAKSVS